MTKKIFFRIVCPIIALLFFFATITPAYVQAQANNKSENAASIYMLKLALGGKNGWQIVSEENRQYVKEKVLIQVENLFNQIEQSGLSDATLQKCGSVLPQGFTENIIMVSDIAKAGMTTEKKLSVLAGAFGYSCNDIMYVGGIVFVLSFFGVIPGLGSMGSLLFAAAALCYLGII